MVIGVPFAQAQLVLTFGFLCSLSVLCCRLRGRASRSSSRLASQGAVSGGLGDALLQAKQLATQPTSALSLAPLATLSSGSNTFLMLSK